MISDINAFTRHALPTKRTVPGGFTAKEIRSKDYIFLKERSKDHMKHKPYSCDFDVRV